MVRKDRKLIARGIPRTEKNARAPDFTSMVGFPMRAGLRARCCSTTFVMSVMSAMQTPRITLTIAHNYFTPPTKRPNGSTPKDITTNTTEFNMSPKKPACTPESYAICPTSQPYTSRPIQSVSNNT